MSWHEIQGAIKVRGTTAVIEVDPEIPAYYRALIPKAHYVQAPMYVPHVTVVRTWERCDHGMLRKLAGKIARLEYENVVWKDGVYYVLNVRSKDLEQLRASIRLPALRPGTTCFHITVANRKGEENRQ